MEAEFFGSVDPGVKTVLVRLKQAGWRLQSGVASSVFDTALAVESELAVSGRFVAETFLSCAHRATPVRTPRESHVMQCSRVNRSNSPKQQQYNQDHDDQPQSAAGAVAPTPTVRPSGKGANQHQYQHYDQYGSQAHGILLEVAG